MAGPLTPPISKTVKRSDEQETSYQDLGCQMNEYDSSKMPTCWDASNGYTLTEEPSDADVLLLNTCSIREKAPGEGVPPARSLEEAQGEAEAGTGDRRGRLRRLPEGGQSEKTRPYVDIVFGPQTLHRLPTMTRSSRCRRAMAPRWTSPSRDREVRQPAEPPAPRATAFVSIMEGCSKYCSFCVVPLHPRRGR